MAKYVVVRPWNSEVKFGEVLEIEKIHPSLAAHVQLMPENLRQFEVATPSHAQQQEKRRDK